jgi:hypothetical protein
MPRNGFTLEYTQREPSFAAAVCFGVLFRAGEVENQVGLDEGSGWDVQDCDFFVGVAGEVLELDLAGDVMNDVRAMRMEGENLPHLRIRRLWFLLLHQSLLPT